MNVKDFFIKYKWYVLIFIIFAGLVIFLVIQKRKREKENPSSLEGKPVTTDPAEFAYGQDLYFTSASDGYEYSTLSTGGTQAVKKVFSLGDIVQFESVNANSVCVKSGGVFYYVAKTNQLKGEKK